MENKKIILIGGKYFEVKEILSRFMAEKMYFKKIQIVGDDSLAGEIHEFRNEPVLVTHLKDMAEEGFDAAILLSSVKNLKKLTSDMVLGNIPLIDMADQFEPSEEIPILLPDCDQSKIEKLPMIGVLPTGEAHAVSSILYALRDVAKWKNITGFILQGVSKTGTQQGMDELFDQSRSILGFQDIEVEHLPHQIAYNTFHADQSAIYNSVLEACARNVCGNPDLNVSVDMAWGAYFVGLIGTLWLTSDEIINVNVISDTLKKSKGILPVKDFGGALGVVGKDEILIDGVSLAYNNSRQLLIRFGLDNLRRGLATSLSELLKKQWLEKELS